MRQKRKLREYVGEGGEGREEVNRLLDGTVKRRRDGDVCLPERTTGTKY